MMSLVYGPSAIAFSDTHPDFYFVGVGPYIRIYHDIILISEFLIFPQNFRIKGIVVQNRSIIVFASNSLKILSFNDTFTDYKIIISEDLQDYVLLAKYTDKNLLTVVLHHGQICQITIHPSQNENEIQKSEISLHHPKVWKIITSAFIINGNSYILGDSFGNISYFENNELICERSFDFGTVFCIDFKEETKEILTANEFRTCSMVKIENGQILPVWSVQNHPSRVWGCKFLPIGPISYGEDGCIHLHLPKIQCDDRDDSSQKNDHESNDDEIVSKTFHLHRTKNITALANRGNDVITAGQNAVLRRLTIFDKLPEIKQYNFQNLTMYDKNLAYNDKKLNEENSSDICTGINKKKDKKVKDPMLPFSMTVTPNGEVVVGTFGGNIISLPNNEVLLSGSQYNAWYLMHSFHNTIFAASRSHHHFLMTKNSSDSSNHIKVFEYPQKCSAISLAISHDYLASVYSDNTLRAYDFQGNEKLNVPLHNYIKKPPIALDIHPTRPIITFGSHSARVVVLTFEDGFSALKDSFFFQSASSDGFRGVVFVGDLIYCAGRTDGTVSIVGECEGKWQLKSSWRIAGQCRATVGIECITQKLTNSVGNEESDFRAVVSVATKDGIALWDIETQTMLAQHPLVGNNDKLCIRFSQNSAFSIAWIDQFSVFLQSNVPAIPAMSIGQSFHGLRGLCMTSMSNSLLATGGCDRDVKLWRIKTTNSQNIQNSSLKTLQNETSIQLPDKYVNQYKIECVESLQAVDSGTHAVCFHKKDSLLFAGGSKEFLYVWKVENDKLFRLNIFKVGDNRKFYQLRVVAMAVRDDKRLFVGMSDGSIRIFDYVGNELNFIEKIELKGVPVSITTTTNNKNNENNDNYDDNGDNVISVVTSTGDAYWIYSPPSDTKSEIQERIVNNEANNENLNDLKTCKIITTRLQNFGLHCIRSFRYFQQLYSITSGDDGSVTIWKIFENTIKTDQNNVAEQILCLKGGHTGGTKALAIEFDANNHLLKLLTFSYDQTANLYKINLDGFELINHQKFDVAVTDGEACEFVEGGFVVFGFAIQFVPTE
ncbi:hypothetical protein TRFO_42519 [Tritrichomonas foetus]|uniref:Uncharacterized protein n=1 Tax=Tritrichomonas foetus TaxID=1144522 RepID=A0A1J4KVS7_9EUKA|nr:hypothetical protein TRFO_42519 [Tritrichomonas foetus]|eukprot:OHT15417.1 hypothetical protein TRFO_42519 [Tritrichomonas foetus]